MSTPITSTEAAEAFRSWVVLLFAGRLNGVLNWGQHEALSERMDLPYATTRWLRSRTVSSAPYCRVGDEDYPGDPGGLTHTKVTQYVREGVVQLAFYGDDGLDMMDEIPLMQAQLPEQQALKDARISVRPLGPVIGLRELRDTHYEPTAVQDWAVVYTTEYEGKTGVLETVETPTTYKAPKE